MRLFALHSAIAFVVIYLLFKQGYVPMPYTATNAIWLYGMLFFCLWLSTYFYRKTYFAKLPKFFVFVFVFIRYLLVANIKVAYDIVTPHYYMRPTILAIPLKAKTDLEITLLANIITLTPGTLSIDVSKDRKVLYVHALYVKNNDVDRIKRSIQNNIERRILELTA
ncbi:Na+/H+ antiporter subunit E [Pontibacter oryzae]|uniref:Cation:proton antiporter n=1 Tax=Pontibacter oryzae TaxID=2304593 RepID=A0A399SF45_9BACT|nr:Na+/H+ antiporter subunit E [Pontibacter oryzae]RIJ41771.1 cation:proton antiporter [Pontibacter oryzae]